MFVFKCPICDKSWHTPEMKSNFNKYHFCNGNMKDIEKLISITRINDKITISIINPIDICFQIYLNKDMLVDNFWIWMNDPKNILYEEKIDVNSNWNKTFNQKIKEVYNKAIDNAEFI